MFVPHIRHCSAKLQVVRKAQTPRAGRMTTCAALQDQSGRRQALGLAAAALVAALAPSAKADLTSDLLAKTEANAELHNKQRLATSYANFARSRTVTDGSCKFPNNVLGCDVGLYAGDVDYIADDAKLECTEKDAGKCASKMSIPQRNK
jgi:photosystem I subunit PsaN